MHFACFLPRICEIRCDRLLREALDRERHLITDKHTEILDCIPYVMVLLLHTDKRTDGR